MQKMALLLCLLLLIVPISAQDSGRGIITEGTITDLDTQLGSLNPLRCNESTCLGIVDKLFPILLAVDPETHWYGEGNIENHALAINWVISNDNLVYIFTLRDDALWSDGNPITAYDYFYSYLAIRSRQIDSRFSSNLLRENVDGIVPLSANQLVIIFKENNCNLLAHINFPIVPAHAFDPEFKDMAADFFGDGDIREQWAAWEENFDYDFSFMVGHPFDREPSVTGGAFEFVEWQPRTHIRLQNGNVAYQFVPVSNSNEAVNMLLNGELTLLENPLRNRWDDLLASEDVQVYHEPSPFWANLVFNFADPRNPQSAFDRHGNPIEQGNHPIFADIRVRQAVQLAIDVPEVTEIALNGLGTPLASEQVPFSWAFDESLEAIGYDLDTAMNLLEDAGWIQVQGRRVRECIGCEFADEGSSLSISLGYDSLLGYEQIAATLIAQQLQRVGFSVNIVQMSFAEAQQQGFDLYFSISWYANYPTLLDSYDIFSAKNDVLDSGWNISSYNNPEVEELLWQARTVSGCNLDARRKLYFEAQRILQADQAFVWLFAENNSYAIHSSVQNFEPIVGMPLVNLPEWLVFDFSRP